MNRSDFEAREYYCTSDVLPILVCEPRTAESDILLVGNSRGLIFYQPYLEELTGKSTFNVSYNGMPINLARVMVQDYLETYKAPKKMIVDVTMCDRLNEQLINSFSLYTPYSPKLDSLIYTLDATTSRATKVSHLFRYNSEIFQRAMFYLNKSDEDWLLDRKIPKNMVKNIDKQEPYSLIERESLLKDTLLVELNDMVSSAEKNGVEVVLVINPYYPPFAKKITNIEAFKNAVENKTGKKVYNYATAINNIEGFGDYQHLNKVGAKAFIDLLQKDGHLD